MADHAGNGKAGEKAQEREIDKIGNPRPLKVNVRILAATNRNLKNLVEDGSFREDLYYRLSVITIELPALRERRDDIPLLVRDFLRQFANRYSTPGLSISGDAMERLVQYHWPGNVRELQNVIEHMAVLARDHEIYLAQLPDNVQRADSRVASVGLKLPEEGIDLEEVEKEILLQALEKHGWNQTHAAKYLNISRKMLMYRMEKFSLLPPAKPAV